MRFLATVLVLLTLAAPVLAADLEQVRKTAESGDLPGALVLARELLAASPEDPQVLEIAGRLAYATEKYGEAVADFTKLKAVSPDDWKVRPRLIQALQADGKLPERDAEIAELYELRRSGRLEDLAKAESYPRDILRVEGLRVWVFEHFELTGEWAVRWVFLPVKDGKEQDWRLSLGSYSFTNDMAHELGTVPKDVRLYHLDGYTPGGHQTYDMYEGEPAYDAVRQKVLGILAGKVAPMSESRMPKEEPKPEKP